jgi:hypothetical protein
MAGVVVDVVVVAVAGGASADVDALVEGKDVADDEREDDRVAVVPAFCSQGFGGDAIVPGVGRSRRRSISGGSREEHVPKSVNRVDRGSQGKENPWTEPKAQLCRLIIPCRAIRLVEFL